MVHSHCKRLSFEFVSIVTALIQEFQVMPAACMILSQAFSFRWPSDAIFLEGWAAHADKCLREDEMPTPASKI